MRRALGALALSLLVWQGVAAQTVARGEVFPLESLKPELRAEAETILLRAMDREALYTVIGGMKPMSSGFLSLQIEVEKADPATMERYRQILATFRSGNDITASLQPFFRVFEGKRFVEAIIFHRGSMRAAIAAQPKLFAGFGLSPSSEPIQAVMGIDGDPTPERNRAYGIFFGYPTYAIDFFVSAEESRRKDGKFVERDFVSIPVFERETNRFVYAVPKGHVRSATDEALAARALPILERYKTLRAEYVGEGKKGIVELIRDWYSDGKGHHSPEIAESKVR